MKTPLFNKTSTKRGLTLIEIIVVLGIFAIILAISMTVFINSRKTASLNSIRDTIVSTLEQAKSNALAGKGGTTHSVVFASSSFTMFTGSTFNASSTSNRIHNIDTGFALSTTYTSNNTVTFSRLNGLPQASGTITIKSLSDASSTKSIQIGTQGDITVVK